MQRQMEVGSRIVDAHRQLITTEGHLAEALGPRGIHVRHPVAAWWPVLQEHLHLYARDLLPGGMLVLAGELDAGSRITGIPFTGAPQARRHLDHATPKGPASPSGARFWRAVERAQEAAMDAPVASLLGTLFLAHARPFVFSSEAAEVRGAHAQHVRTLLETLRPQAVVAVGKGALQSLGDALHDDAWRTVAATAEEDWLARWPVEGSPMRHPACDVPALSPFRTRVVPVPDLTGKAGAAGEDALARLLAYAWA